MLTAYLLLALWFWMIDMAAGHVAKAPPRPIAAAVLATLWPLSVAFALLASAVIVGRLREIERHPTPPDPDPQEVPDA